MYKLIACDLDETLLNPDKSICQKNIDAIAKAKKMGVKFVPATGRPFNSAYKTLKELSLYNEPEEYMISFNGGAITENYQDKLLHFEGITFDQAKDLFNAGIKYDVCIHIYTLDTVYVYRLNEDEVAYLDGRMEVKEFFEDSIDFLKNEPIVKCLYENTDRDYLESIAADLKEMTQNMDVSYSSNRYLEFNKEGVNKGAALLKLADLLGVDHKDTIAIGDNFNDLSMIKDAGLGVGVANTVEKMKPECDVITSRTCEEGAVAEVIEKYIFNPQNHENA